MVKSLGEYLTAISAVAILCSIVNQFPFQGTVARLMRFMTGLVLSLAVIAPWSNINLEGIGDYTQDIQGDAIALTQEGKDASVQAFREGIIRQTEAYISDKARTLGLSIMVEVTLSDNELPVPKSVTLTGSASPYAKQQLSDMLTQELGIPVEAQAWKQS